MPAADRRRSGGVQFVSWHRSTPIAVGPFAQNAALAVERQHHRAARGVGRVVFGSAEIGAEQAVMLKSVAAAIRDASNANPGEVFLIEGHTDAVGSDQDNLSLSDRRAQTVADVLSQQFSVPVRTL